MHVQLELYASLMQYLPANASRHSVGIEVPSETTAFDLLDRYQVPHAEAHLVMRNGIYLHPEERGKLALSEGDVVAVWPPVAGG